MSISDAGGISGSVIWKDATGAVIPNVDYEIDADGNTFLWVIDRSTGAVWVADALTGAVDVTLHGVQYPFIYTSSDCSGTAYFIPMRPALFTFYAGDGNIYAPKGNVAWPTISAGSSRPLQSPVATCSGGSAGKTIAVEVSDCLNLGTTPPSSLFVAPAHPEALP